MQSKLSENPARKRVLESVLLMSGAIILIASRTGLTKGVMASEQRRMFGRHRDTQKEKTGKFLKRPHSGMEATQISESKLYIQIHNPTLPGYMVLDTCHMPYECPLLV